MTTPAATAARPLAPMPALPAAAFVLVWCTGYIAGPLGVDAVEPLSLVWLRFAVAAAVAGAVARWRYGPLRLDRGTLLRLSLAGLAINGATFAGMYLAFEVGMGGTVAALLHSLSPVLTVLLAAILLAERLRLVQLVGFVVGVAGVVVVLAPDIDAAGGAVGLLFGAIGTLGLSLGTLGQRWAADHAPEPLDPWWSATVQFTAAVPPCLVLAVAVEGTSPIIDPGAAVLTIGWLALVNSVVGLLLLGVLVRTAGAGASSSLFFLMPPVTAVMSFVVLGERFGVNALIGLLLTVAGVLLATRRRRVPVSSP